MVIKKIGTKTYPNGTKYKGEIDKEGHPHGKGTMIFPKQFTYIHKGKKYISNVLISSWGKKKYVGQFFHGLMHGKGTATYRNGSIYEGEFKNNQEHGKGTMKEGVNTYKIRFKNGLPPDWTGDDFV